MLRELYSIYDRKTRVYSAPMVMVNDAQAKRAVLSEMRHAESMLGQYPEDYDLYMVGTFDDATAELLAMAPADLVCRLDSLLEGERTPPGS